MINIIGLCWWLAAVLATCAGEKWAWPETAASVRIDTKVKFLDGDYDQSDLVSHVRQSDEVPFVPASETDGFYNRPPNSGRYPVRVETHQAVYTQGKNYGQKGTLDSIQYCKCVSTPDCQIREDSSRACGDGKYLCCYRRSNRVNPHNSEYFNEIEDERPMLFPGRENFAKPFPPPDSTGLDEDHPSILVGPGGPTGDIGPTNQHAVLVGPGGPTGVIGPNKPNDVLVGPGGPTGVIGPGNRGVQPGPIGPRDIHPDETAQRGVLVGPGGPTGVIGPAGYGGRRQVLVGPGGPTGVIGPRMPGYFGQGYGRQGFGRQTGPGVLVGPGGPTGVIGPGRQILVGPGGPTGVIGPQGYYAHVPGCSRNRKRKYSSTGPAHS